LARTVATVDAQGIVIGRQRRETVVRNVERSDSVA
jgi:hypothetical protein